MGGDDGIMMLICENVRLLQDAQTIHVYDPRSRIRWFSAKKEIVDLIIPNFKV